MAASSPQRERLDATAFSAALSALAPADLLRLAKKSALYSPGTGMTNGDLLQEAIRRTLDGERICPADVSAGVYLDNAMRSIANGEREKYARHISTDNSDDDFYMAGDHADPSLSAEAKAVEQDELERTLVRLEAMFADDPQALAVVIGDMEGWSAAEIREAESMDEKQYSTARRRVRRAIEREFNGANRS